MPRTFKSAKKHFEGLFGDETDIPTSPGVYRFWKGDEVIYVGKAKHLRRRLFQYRAASRKKADRKRRKIVLLSDRLDWVCAESEREALLLEDQLIKKLRPILNVDGAFFFIYPAFGLKESDEGFELTYSTDPRPSEGLQWFGCFRSRLLAREAFEALEEICSLLCFPARKGPKREFSRVVRFRQREESPAPLLRRFLAGEDQKALGELAEQLLERAQAVNRASEVQQFLVTLRDFQKKEILPIANARRHFGHTETFVAQEDRDRWMIEWRTLQAEQ
jgi:excinuclease UvrABC nuclease subunit